jgi:hypothetical protein
MDNCKTKLYITESLGNHRFFQFDLSNNNSQTIIDSIHSAKGLQLGNDGKIYVARSSLDAHYIGVINNPDSIGINCNYLSEW